MEEGDIDELVGAERVAEGEEWRWGAEEVDEVEGVAGSIVPACCVFLLEYAQGG